MNRRPFIFSSLDEHTDAYIKAAFMASDKTPVFFSPPGFFMPTYRAHVDKWGIPDESNTSYDLAADRLYGEWITAEFRRQYPKSGKEYMELNSIIYPQVTTGNAYDASKQRMYEIDEVSQWVTPRMYTKVDLSTSIKKLLKMDTLFDEDYKRLLEWLKTFGKPIYLSGHEYFDMMKGRGRIVARRFGTTLFHRCFTTY